MQSGLISGSHVSGLQSMNSRLKKKKSVLLQIGLSAISRNGFVTDGLLSFWHCGNYDGLGNYITNNPFPSELVDLTGNGNNLVLQNFAGTEASGANGNNTVETPSYIKLDGSDDRMSIPTLNWSAGTPPVFSVAFIFELDNWSYNQIFGQGFGTSIFGNVSQEGRIRTRVYRNGSTIYNRDISGYNTSGFLQWGVQLKTGEGAFIEVIRDGGITANRSISEDYPASQSWNTLRDAGAKFVCGYAYSRILTAGEVAQNYNTGLVWQ